MMNGELIPQRNMCVINFYASRTHLVRGKVGSHCTVEIIRVVVVSYIILIIHVDRIS
jgi:hypothetical protein